MRTRNHYPSNADMSEEARSLLDTWYVMTDGGEGKGGEGKGGEGKGGEGNEGEEREGKEGKSCVAVFCFSTINIPAGPKSR